MTYQEIVDMVEDFDLPFAYDHFEEGESPDPPFVVFLFPNSDNFAADNRVYYKINQLHIELYTDEKNPELEETIEDTLDKHDMYYEKYETWIPNEKLYEVLYEMEVENA